MKRGREGQLYDLTKITPVVSDNAMFWTPMIFAVWWLKTVALCPSRIMSDNPNGKVTEINTLMFKLLFLNNQVTDERLTIMALFWN